VSDPQSTSAPATAEPTTGGNYFVANYPPFSFWTRDRVHEAHEVLQRAPAPGTPLGLYVHIPFCRKRCHFCYFKVYTDKNAKQITDYIGAVLHELRLYKDLPFRADRAPRFVYFGGGTPSYLSVAQLRTLTDGLKALLPWDEVEEVTFECEPGTLSLKKLEFLREMGVTRLSLGVESFNEEILRLNNRAHGADEIDRAYRWAKEVDFPQINIDLIAGMLGETDKNWTHSVDRTLELAPDAVTIYQMEIPFNTTIYHDMKQGGSQVAPVADWATKRRWVAEAFARLEASGYRVGSAYTAVRETNEETRFIYRDALWTGADLLALGVASFSHVGGTHFQNHRGIEPYRSSLANGELPIARALAMEAEERLVREFVLQLKLGRLEASRFEERFGVDVLDRFREPLAGLAGRGMLAVKDGAIVLTRTGLLQVDTLLHEFFLEKHRDAPYV
jgi:oxygen-independent coproporphyrinogen-3 oxidase